MVRSEASTKLEKIRMQPNCPIATDKGRHKHVVGCPSKAPDAKPEVVEDIPSGARKKATRQK